MTNQLTPLVDDHTIRTGRSVFRALNHALRQQMLALIHQHQRMIVTDIYVTMKIEQSVASQHLAVLRAAKIVKAQREGQKIFYSVNYQRIKDIHFCSEKLLQ